MEDRLPRKLAAILYADVAGYSRLTGDDEDATHRTLSEHLDLISRIVEEHRGQVMHYAGDAVLAKFDAVVDTMSAAVGIQKELKTRNEGLPNERKVQFRIGVNLGDVIEDRGDIYGDGVNVAARLESLAEPGGICISDAVRTAVGKKLDFGYEFLGEQEVKNIAEPVRAYKVVMENKDEPRIVSPQTPTLDLPDKPSIAVLPFTNMSGDPEQEFFTDGITEDIITTLSKVPRLFVISRNSTFVYKGRAIDVKEVAADQGVRYVLEGSVRKAGNRVRITAQLIDTSSGLHDWADHYDGNLDDVFALQDKISQEIVSALEVNLSEGEQARLWRQRAGDPRVYEQFLRGRALYQQFTTRTNAQARQKFEAAIQLNPEFAIAYVFLGYTYSDEVRWGWSSDPDQSLRMQSDMVRKALELDPDLVEAHAAVAYFHLLRREHDEATALAERLAPLGPSNAETHHMAAMIFNYSGLPEQGMSLAKQAIRLSPMAYGNYLTELGHSHCLLGQYDEAIAVLRPVLADLPFWRTTRALLVLALYESSRLGDARTEANEVLRAAPRFSLSRWADCHPYRRQDDLDRYINALRNSGLPE